jgi:glycosyltransferase involved in cell wall biosynthesis
LGGADVDVVSTFRSFRPKPPSDGMAELYALAGQEVDRIVVDWSRRGAPDAFFCYHPYYKAPDLVGPTLCRRFGVPYITAEASYSRRRDGQGWGEMQAHVGAAIGFARVNISMTERDREGLIANFPDARTAILPPFIDAAPYLVHAPEPVPGRLVTVAMMRPGDKLDSYIMLAAALAEIEDADWTLSVVGDGPAHGEVQALFARFERARVQWHGQLDQDAVADVLSTGDVLVWPGCGEAYGLAYLEAQAAGLPVVAQAIAGVPSVVRDGVTGVLTAPGNVSDYAQAIEALLTDRERRAGMARAARDFASGERSIAVASGRLMALVSDQAGDAS